ncbi:MAG: phosphatidylinositol transfer protein [Labilithrix sp.]
MRVLAAAGAIGLMLFAVGCSTTAGDDPDTSAGELTTAPCLPTLECAAPPPPNTHRHFWRHWIETPAIVTTDAITGFPAVPNHRGRDLFVNPGAPQTIIAQFAYGLSDVDLEDEDVEIFVQRDCASGWESLGIATTTSGSQPHADVEGISDHGGRIIFEIPKAKELGPGRHRVRLVVRGDESFTDLFIDVVPPQTPIFVSDVDGTLTSSENIEYAALLVGTIPATHPAAPEALRALADKGYRPLYLTARPEWLVGRTREFLDQHGFPPGIIHTTASLIGPSAYGGAAQFKSGDLAQIATKGLVPAFGFGNKPTDSEAYAVIPDVSHRFFYQIDGEFTGRRIESYEDVLPQLTRLPAVCQK